jgi:very-short-patch-repair endonuclease
METGDGAEHDGVVTGSERRARAGAVAAGQGGVVSRRQLRELGITHDHVRNEVAAERWVALGRQGVAIHLGPLPVIARAWSAIWEVGERIAVLDGVTSLVASGLTGFDEDLLHLSVRHSHDIPTLEGVRVHKLIRRMHGAFIRGVVRDVALGVESLGELDFARLCRARGLPEPSRQVVRQGPQGRIYLDVRWDDHGLVVEIDGAQHREGLAVSIDNLSRNAVVLTGDRVLRIDRIGLRLHEDAFMAQVAMGLATSRSR